MRSGRERMESLAALVVFGAFAVSVAAVLLTGAGERRTRSQYIATRVRQAAGAASVAELGGEPALRLPEGDGYVTWVYCRDGWLMELYTSEESELGPEDGTRLMEAESLSARLEEGLLEVRVTGPGGESDRLYLSLRVGEEAGE